MDKHKAKTKIGKEMEEQIKNTLEEHPYVVINKTTYANISKPGSGGKTDIGVYKAIHKTKNIYDFELVYVRNMIKGDINNREYEGKPKRKSILKDIKITSITKTYDDNLSVNVENGNSGKIYLKPVKDANREEKVYFAGLKEVTGKDIKYEYTEEELKQLWASRKYIVNYSNAVNASKRLEGKRDFSFDKDDTPEEKEEFFEDLYFANPEVFSKIEIKSKPKSKDINTKRSKKEYEEWLSKKKQVKTDMTEKGKETDNKMKNQCPICKKEFENLRLHETKAHKKDMWKVVIPKNLMKDEPKLYNYGREMREFDNTDSTVEDDGTIHRYYYMYEVEANTLKNVSGITLGIFTDKDGKVVKKDKADMMYEFTDRHGKQDYKNADANTISFEFA